MSMKLNFMAPIPATLTATVTRSAMGSKSTNWGPARYRPTPRATVSPMPPRSRALSPADGRQWYLDPLAQSSGNNEMPDGTACSEDGSHQLTCVDTDGDNVPDVFDLDDDGDGVPDTVDSAGTRYVGDKENGLTDQTFQLDLNGVAIDQSIFVDFQLRPTNPEHLWYSLSVLDWPGNDRAGQVQRVHHTPLGSSGSDADGDMRLIPMLEVEMSGTPLPLPLTTPQTSVSVSGVATGTVAFTQQGGDIELSFALEAGAYDAKIYAAKCGTIGDATAPSHQFAGVADGTVTQITGVSLATGLADGAHAIRLRTAAARTSAAPFPTLSTVVTATRWLMLMHWPSMESRRAKKITPAPSWPWLPLVLQYEQAGNYARRFHRSPLCQAGNGRLRQRCEEPSGLDGSGQDRQLLSRSPSQRL